LPVASGLEIPHLPRSCTPQKKIGLLSKHDCRDAKAAGLKRKKVLVVTLSDRLCATNVLSIIMSDDIGKHDLAADCQPWQVGLWGLRKVLRENVMN